MAESQYNVEAKLTLDTMKARRNALRLQRDIMNVGKQITKLETVSGKATDKLTRGMRQARPEVARTSGALGGLMRNLLGMGAVYVALRSVVGGMKALATGALEYNVEIERTKIGLTAIFQALSNGQQSWSQAANTSDKVFNDLQADAIKSVATTQELFGVYQAIVGPIMAAGAGMDVVRKLTNDTVAASSVLNVDLAQAQRDIGMMVRGTAGVDVKLFSVLKSTGAIAENAEQWNKNLSAGQRIAKLQTALGKFAPAGERFGKSWAGVTSTFKDIRQQFTQSAMKPVIDTMGRSLDRVNTYLINNQDRIRGKLTAWGESFAAKIESAFARAAKAADWVGKNWDGIISRMGALMREAKGWAKALAIGGVASQVGGAAMNVGGMVGGMLGGEAAAGAGAGVLAGVGGAAGSVVALTLAIAALGTAAAVSEQQVKYKGMAKDVGGTMTGWAMDFSNMVANFGKATIVPGSVFANSMAEWTAEATVTGRALTKGAGDLALWTAGVMDWLSGGKAARDREAADTAAYVHKLTGLWGEAASTVVIDAERLFKKMTKLIPHDKETALGELGKQFGTADEISARYMARGAATGGLGAPGGRTQTNIDMRGSKINVKQEFKSADPDRVLVDMVNALSQQAEMRIQSGYAPALGRG